jgi:chromosome segregation ATPase
VQATAAQLEVNSLNLQLGQKNSELATLQQQLHDGSQQFQTGGQQFTDLQQQYSTLQTQYSQLQQQLQTAQHNLGFANDQIKSIQAQPQTGNKRQRIEALVPELSARLQASGVVGSSRNIKLEQWRAIFTALELGQPPADKTAAADVLLSRLLD